MENKNNVKNDEKKDMPKKEENNNENIDNLGIRQFVNPCKGCGSPAIPGEDYCYSCIGNHKK